LAIVGPVAHTKKVETVARERSEATDRYLLCPLAQDLHPQLLAAPNVKRGPKVFWIECSVCGTNIKIAPRILRAADKSKAYGHTMAAVVANGWTPLP